MRSGPNIARKSLLGKLLKNDTDSYNLMKHLQYPLLISRIKFYDQYGGKAEEKFQRLESAFATAPELEEVYNAYQDFLDIVSANGFKYQRERLNNWIKDVKRSMYGAHSFVKSKKTHLANLRER